MSISGISQLLRRQFGPNFKGKVKEWSWQCQDRVKAMLRQDHGNFNESSREGKCMVRAISSKVEARPKQRQGNVKTKSGQVHGKVKDSKTSV